MSFAFGKTPRINVWSLRYAQTPSRKAFGFSVSGFFDSGVIVKAVRVEYVMVFGVEVTHKFVHLIVRVYGGLHDYISIVIVYVAFARKVVREEFWVVHCEAERALGEAFSFDADVVEVFVVKGSKVGGIGFQFCFYLFQQECYFHYGLLGNGRRVGGRFTLGCWE
jgi:hypothetical protein